MHHCHSRPLFPAKQLFFVVSFFLCVTFATDGTFANESVALLDNVQPKPSSPNSLSLSLYNETYRVNAGNQYPALMLGGKASSKSERWETYGDAEGYLNVHDTTARYLNVREAYGGLNGDTTPVRALFGRKLEDWSTLDTYWQLGLWQPRFRWNYLNPDAVGLTGFFFSKETANVQASVFASPIYIPELGAQPNLNDGVFTSSNRFVALPPRQIALFGTSLPAKYALDTPPISDIVFNPSVSALVRIGGRQGAWSKASYAYEPVNRIMLAYEGYLYVANQDIEITLHPRIVYHHVAALEGGYTGKRWSAWVSVMGEHPEPDSTPGFWTRETITPALMASTAVDFEAFGQGVQASHFSMSYIFSAGGASPDQGPLSSPTRSIFESRYPFRSAASLRTRIPLLNRGTKSFELATKSVYEFTVSGVLLSLDLTYKFDEHWDVGLGGDALGNAGEQATNGGADFTYLNRADDRIRGKVSYFF